jgi:predicted lipoprotein with Yx(FWY)xxD motif
MKYSLNVFILTILASFELFYTKLNAQFKISSFLELSQLPSNVTTTKTYLDSIKINQSNLTLGAYIVDQRGHALYLHRKDRRGRSQCYGECEKLFIPALKRTNVKINLERGLNQRLLGQHKRRDGSLQVTYNNNPLYYFANDKSPNDTLGHTHNMTWYLVTPSGTALIKRATSREVDNIPAAPRSIREHLDLYNMSRVNLSTLTPLKLLIKSSQLGDYLTEELGLPLYIFMGDKPGISNCTGRCASTWPPFSVPQNFTFDNNFTTSDRIRKELLGTIDREDGRRQLTYNKWPLYIYSLERSPNETLGHGKREFGDLWLLISPEGQPINKTDSDRNMTDDTREALDFFVRSGRNVSSELPRDILNRTDRNITVANESMQNMTGKDFVLVSHSGLASMVVLPDIYVIKFHMIHRNNSLEKVFYSVNETLRKLNRTLNKFNNPAFDTKKIIVIDRNLKHKKGVFELTNSFQGVTLGPDAISSFIKILDQFNKKNNNVIEYDITMAYSEEIIRQSKTLLHGLAILDALKNAQMLIDTYDIENLDYKVYRIKVESTTLPQFNNFFSPATNSYFPNLFEKRKEGESIMSIRLTVDFKLWQKEEGEVPQNRSANGI